MFSKIIRVFVLVTFLFSGVMPLPQAQAAPLLGLPEPGKMVSLSVVYRPTMIKGLTVHKDNPFLFDFIVDRGQDRLDGEALKNEGQKLIKYFLASVAIPEKDLWVNLSPYEKDRTIPQALGQTEMGRDLLAQDYMLKQITASLIYPEKELGKSFWNKVYAKAQEMYGTSNVPVNTFNKVWIVADEAGIFERNQSVFVVDCHLKVMLEEDYLALSKNTVGVGSKPTQAGYEPAPTNNTHSISSQIVREIILPEIEKEVNTGKNFANLRQIFNSLVLATWYKKNLKQGLINQVYSNKQNVKGIDLNDPNAKEQIYQRYLQAYKKGVFNFIKEEGLAQARTPRKYFSGGVNSHIDFAQRSEPEFRAAASDNGDLAILSSAAVMGDGSADRALLAARINPKWQNKLAPYIGEDNIINSRTRKLMAELTKKYAVTIKNLLEEREAKQNAVNESREQFTFLDPNTGVEDAYGNTSSAEQIRKSDWKVNSIPEELTRPGAILTGPWSTFKWAINALRSGAVRLFWDREDAGWDKGVEGMESEKVARDIINGKVKEHTEASSGKKYIVPDRKKWPVITNRVRGLHFDSKFFSYGKSITPAIIEDLVTYIVNNYQALQKVGSGIYIVLPKLQNAKEVKLAVQMIADIERSLGLSEGTIRVILMVETIELTLELEEALWAGRKHIAITNVGRWDKMATDIRFRQKKSNEVMPDPNTVTMESPNQEAYVGRTANITIRRGAEIEGGMFALMKSRNGAYPETDQKVEQMVVNDKTKERKKFGMKFAWVATPQLVTLVNKIFRAGRYAKRSHKPYDYSEESLNGLLQLPKGKATVAGFKRAIYDQLAYAIGQRTSGGAVAIIVEDPKMPGLRAMQDYAIQKINYYWTWFLNHHQITLDEGVKVTPAYLTQVIDEQIEHIKNMKEADKFSDADWDAVKKVVLRLNTFHKLLPWESIVMNAVIDETKLTVIDAKLDEVFANAAMKTEPTRKLDQAALAISDPTTLDPTRGGIDLNTTGMKWKYSKDGKPIEMTVDPAMLARVTREGIDSLNLLIYKVTPLMNIWSTFGMKSPVK